MTATLSLGIDPAKRKFTACLLGADGPPLLAPEDFPCELAGFEALLERLRPHRAGASRMFVGVEASASLDDNLLAFFASDAARADGPLTLLRLDAGQVARFSEARPVRGKTDSADARRIAAFTRAHAERLDAFELDERAQAMARLMSERAHVVQDATALANRIQDRLVVSFPEFDKVFAEPCGELPIALLAKLPTAAAWAKKRPASLAEIRARKGGHCLGIERAERLVKLAKDSIASATAPSDAGTISHFCALLQLNRERLAQIEAEIRAYVKETPEAAPSEASTQEAEKKAEQGKPPATIPEQIVLADSLPGFALVNSAVAVLRARGLGRFASAKAFAAQIGACPDRRQTGSSKDSARLTHRGDRVARSNFYLSTLSACGIDPAMAFHKWRLQRKGLRPKQAVCACMNRYAKILWAVVHSQTPYDPRKGIDNAKRHHAELWKTFVKDELPKIKNMGKESRNLAAAA